MARTAGNSSSRDECGGTLRRGLGLGSPQKTGPGFPRRRPSPGSWTLHGQKDHGGTRGLYPEFHLDSVKVWAPVQRRSHWRDERDITWHLLVDSLPKDRFVPSDMTLNSCRKGGRRVSTKRPRSVRRTRFSRRRWLGTWCCCPDADSPEERPGMTTARIAALLLFAGSVPTCSTPGVVPPRPAVPSISRATPSRGLVAARDLDERRANVRDDRAEGEGTRTTCSASTSTTHDEITGSADTSRARGSATARARTTSSRSSSSPTCSRGRRSCGSSIFGDPTRRSSTSRSMRFPRTSSSGRTTTSTSSSWSKSSGSPCQGGLPAEHLPQAPATHRGAGSVVTAVRPRESRRSDVRNRARDYIRVCRRRRSSSSTTTRSSFSSSGRPFSTTTSPSIRLFPFPGARTRAEQGVHLVIADVRLPEMDGFEFRSRMREIPRHAEVPFLFLRPRIRRSR